MSLGRGGIYKGNHVPPCHCHGLACFTAFPCSPVGSWCLRGILDCQGKGNGLRSNSWCYIFHSTSNYNLSLALSSPLTSTIGQPTWIPVPPYGHHRLLTSLYLLPNWSPYLHSPSHCQPLCRTEDGLEPRHQGSSQLSVVLCVSPNNHPGVGAQQSH